jgi:hypothetical protein
MAYNSDTVKAVYGATTLPSASAEKVGDDNLFNAGVNVEVAAWSIASTTASTGGEHIRCVVLPEGAVIVGYTLTSPAAWGASGSTLTPQYDGVDIGTAITVGTSANADSVTINGRSTTGFGVFSLKESAHAFAKDLAVSGEVFYYIP